MAKSLGMIKQDLYPVQFLLAKPEWAKYLTTNVEADFRKAMKWLGNRDKQIVR